MQHGSLRKVIFLLGFAAFVAFFAGCKKQVGAPPPAPTPAPAAQPTVTLNASPSSINPGQTVTLSWSSTAATDLDVQPGVGKVAPQGSTPVNPTESTTYTITAAGSGGTATASARVDVLAAAAAPPTRPAGPPNVQELFDQNVRDAFFDLDKSDLRPDARTALTKDA
jgi:peptidoglycan-associated lipoprotein